MALDCRRKSPLPGACGDRCPLVVRQVFDQATDQCAGHVAGQACRPTATCCGRCLARHGHPSAMMALAAHQHPSNPPLVRIFMRRPTQRKYAVEGPAPYDVLRACDDGPEPSSVSARWRAPRHPGFAPSVNRPQWKSHCGFAYPTRAILGGDHTTLLVCLTYSRFTRPLARLITSCIQSGKPCRSKSVAVGDRQCSTGSRRSKS